MADEKATMAADAAKGPSDEEGAIPATQGPATAQEAATKPAIGRSIFVLLAALCLCLYLVNVEVTIVSTSLLAITNDLDGFYQAGYVVSGYLVTYSSFIVLWAKLSDILGRKSCILGAVGIFTCFSAGCGAARSMTALVACRVFQGVGAAGCYSMAMVVFFEAVPPRWYGAGGGLLTSFIALATLSGPLLGGAISEHTTWRWIFLLNIPLGVVTFAMLAFSIPRGFPNHGQAKAEGHDWRQRISKPSLKKIDVIGAALLVVATMLLVTAVLQAGGGDMSWSSPLVVSFLVLSGICWTCFAVWERRISKREQGSSEPIFPWRFVKNRAWMGMLLLSFLCGIPFNVITVDLPQRFQSVNGLSAVDAGIRLLPFSLGAPVASMATTVIAGKVPIPVFYLVAGGSCLQLIGTGLLTSIPSTTEISPAQYGYQIITAVGVGVTFGILMLAVPFAVEKRDLATATGSTIQTRMLGGAIGLAIGSSILNQYVWTHLAPFLEPDQVENIRKTSSAISRLPADLQVRARLVFAQGFRLQMVLACVVAGVSLVATLIVWRRKQLVARAGGR